MAAPVIGMTITAADNTAATIDKINARLEAFGKRTQASMERATAPMRKFGQMLRTVGDVSGLTKVAGSFRGLARAGLDAYQKVGQVVPLLGIIGGAASVAGITRMVEAWDEWGSKVGFTAQRIGISAEKLSAFQGAARLAGSSADGAANGLQTLGQTMYDAIGGRAPEAIVMFRTLGIAFQDASGHARSVADVLPEVADKIKGIRDPFAQAQVATTLFGGAAEDLLPFLRKGSAGIREYVETAKRYGVINDASAAAANRLREAQARVSLATEGLRNRIAERLEPVLTPLLSHFSEWIATSPAVAHAVEWLGQEVQQLGTWIDGGGLQRFGDTMQHWGDVALGIMDALGGPQKAIEGLIALMVGSFALKVIAPFWTLGTAIAAATLKLGGLSRGMAGLQGGGLLGWAGKLGGLLGGIGLGAAGWEGLNLAQDATQPSGNGYANLLHNMLFDMNPLHWTQSYHPGQQAGAGPSTGSGGSQGQLGKPGAMSNLPPAADLAQREKLDFDYLRSQGLSPQAAAGVVANLETESGLQAHGKPGDGGLAYGKGQWHPDRQANFAQIFGHDIRQSTDAEQLMFRAMELKGTGGDSLSAKGYQLMNAPGVTAGQAGALDSVYGERPADQAGEARRRRVLAEQIYARQMQAPPIAPPQAQGAPMQLSTAKPSGNQADGGSDSTVRLHITGDPGYRASVVSNPAQTPVAGPLVERPMLIGANP